MQQSMKTRILTLLLAIFMVLSLFPPALAAGTAAHEVEIAPLRSPNIGEWSLRLQGNGLGIAANGFALSQSGPNLPTGNITLEIVVRGTADRFDVRFGGSPATILINEPINAPDWTTITRTVPVGTPGWQTPSVQGSTSGGDALYIASISITGVPGWNFANHDFASGSIDPHWNAFGWAGNPLAAGSGWSVVSNIPDFTVTVAPASTALVGGGTVDISPEGPQRAGTPMTVSVRPPDGHEIAAGTLAVSGVPNLTPTDVGATFPMPVGGGELLVNAVFTELDFRSALEALVDEIDGLNPEDWSDASWAALDAPLTAARLLLADPGATTVQLRDAYLALRTARNGLVGADTVAFADFSGRLGEWGSAVHTSVAAGGLTLRATAGGSVLYTIIEGADRDTRNVYYISIAGRPGGFARHGRPNVHYLVANGFLYEATAPQGVTATPEWFGAGAESTATRLDRVSMEYWTNWTGMRLRLDQIGNPDPADISISWQGFSTGFASTTPAHLPAGGEGFMSLGASFDRYQAPGGYTPDEYFGLIFNPLMGGGGNMLSAGPPTGQVMGYAYVSWRSLEPVPGVLDLSAARLYEWDDYPTVGPNRDTWGSRGPLLQPLVTAYAGRGHYVQLRMIMDLPAGQRGPGGNSPANAQINLMNRRVADIPAWAIQAMRHQSNRPNDACPHNIPFEADRRLNLQGVDDGLYDRMRNPADPDYIFFQAFRDQPLYTATTPAPAGISAPATATVPDGYFRCTIPSPTGGAHLRVCPNGCEPYGRPDFRATPSPGQVAAGWFPNQNWGPEGVWYNSYPDISGGVGLAPRYDHHMLLFYHERIMNTLAEAIGTPGSPWNAVAQVQLGSLGHWGEWHNWPTADKDTFPNAEVAYPFVQHYIDAFAGMDNVQIAMRYANWIATKYDLGIFHDEAAQGSHFSVFNTVAGQNLSVDNFAPNGWGRGHNTGNTSITNNLNANMTNVPSFTGLANAAEYANAARNPNFWMRGGWSGGEYGDTSAPGRPHGWIMSPNDPSNAMRDVALSNAASNAATNSIMRTIYAFRWANTSNLLPRGPQPGHSNPISAAAQQAHKNNDAAYDNMGYRFVVQDVEVDGILRRGETVDVSMVVVNRGVAPFHRSWPFEVSFIDQAGNVAHRMNIDEVDISEWMPRHRAINNARPPADSYRYAENALGETHRVYYRSTALLRDLPIRNPGDPHFIPAHNGRNYVEFALAIPTTLSGGEYTLAIAILDPVLQGGNPGIRFHNVATRPDGRLLLEPFVVGLFENARRWNATAVGEGTVTPAGFANPGDPVTIMVDPRVGYSLAGITVAGAGIDSATVTSNLAARTVTFPMPAGAIDDTLAVNVTLTWSEMPPRTWHGTVDGLGTLTASTGEARPGSEATLTLNERRGYELSAIAVAGTGIAQGSVTYDLEAQTITFLMPAGDAPLDVIVTPTWEELPPAFFDPGNYSLRLQGNGAISWDVNARFTPHRSVALTAAEYTLTFFAKGNATGFMVEADMYPNRVLFVPARTIDYDDWTEITVTVPVTVPGGHTLRLVASTAATNDLFLDDFSLVGPAGTNLLAANNDFETGDLTNWHSNGQQSWLGNHTNADNPWSVVAPPVRPTHTVTVDPASTALVGGTVQITPEGAHPRNLPMTVTITPPVQQQIVPGSLEITGVPFIRLTADGATFPMPAGGGTITVNATFTEIDYTERLTELVGELSMLISGGDLVAEDWTPASWTHFITTHGNSYALLFANPTLTQVREAYYALREAWASLAPAEAADPTGISFTLPATIRRNQAVTPVLTVLPANALQEATWTSSSPALASVDPNTGAVTARATSGTVVITATTLCGNFRHSVTVRLSA